MRERFPPAIEYKLLPLNISRSRAARAAVLLINFFTLSIIRPSLPPNQPIIISLSIESRFLREGLNWKWKGYQKGILHQNLINIFFIIRSVLSMEQGLWGVIG